MDEDVSLSAPLESTALPEAEGYEQVGSAINMPEIDNNEISKFFGFAPGDMIDAGDRDMLKVIWNHFAPQAKTPGEVIRLISKMEREVAPPNQGESRLGRFYTYIRLLSEEDSIKDEIAGYRK